MVAAGTGPTVAITLFVIGEGRWEPQNFPSSAVLAKNLTWDFTTMSSNYAQARLALLGAKSGRTWNNAYSAQGVLLEPDAVGGGIAVGSQTFSTVADAYVQQGLNNGETTQTACLAWLDTVGVSSELVSGACLGMGTSSGTGGGSGAGGSAASSSGAGGGSAGTGGAGGSAGGTGGTGGSAAGAGGGGGVAGTGGGNPCALVPAGEIDASLLACGKLDDIAVALVGMHPADVWLTRLEAGLPHEALATDLDLQAAPDQEPVGNIFNLTKYTGNPCPAGQTVSAGTTGGTGEMRGSGALRGRLALVGAGLAVLGAALARRRRRATAAQPAR